MKKEFKLFEKIYVTDRLGNSLSNEDLIKVNKVEDVKEATQNLKKEVKKNHIVRLEGHITPDYKEGFWEGVNFMRKKTDKAFEKHIGDLK